MGNIWDRKSFEVEDLTEPTKSRTLKTKNKNKNTKKTFVCGRYNLYCII